MAAQFTATKGPLARGLNVWIARATNSLPVPLSPVTNTAALLGATWLINEKTCFITAELPTISTSEPLLASVRSSTSVLRCSLPSERARSSNTRNAAG